jgi:hypothetical protein
MINGLSLSEEIGSYTLGLETDRLRRRTVHALQISDPLGSIPVHFDQN